MITELHLSRGSDHNILDLLQRTKAKLSNNALKKYIKLYLETQLQYGRQLLKDGNNKAIEVLTRCYTETREQFPQYTKSIEFQYYTNQLLFQLHLHLIYANQSRPHEAVRLLFELVKWLSSEEDLKITTNNKLTPQVLHRPSNRNRSNEDTLRMGLAIREMTLAIKIMNERDAFRVPIQPIISFIAEERNFYHASIGRYAVALWYENDKSGCYVALLEVRKHSWVLSNQLNSTYIGHRSKFSASPH